MEEIRYKVGEHVKIIDNLCEHQFKIGEIVEIISIFEDNGLIDEAKSLVDEDDIWCICEEEVEKI